MPSLSATSDVHKQNLFKLSSIRTNTEARGSLMVEYDKRDTPWRGGRGEVVHAGPREEAVMQVY